MDEKIILRPDWDYQPKIGIYSGHHITRESEHRILLDFIARRNEGSMLVCGQRGVGKTSSVFKATNDAVAHDKKIKPVLLKATSTNLDEDGDPKRGILRDLVRSLYTRVHNDPGVARELKKKTSELYSKAMASEVKHESQSTDKSVREWAYYIHANLVPALLLIAVGSLSFLGVVSENSWILPGVAMAGGWLLFGHFITRRRSSVAEASDYYRYDYDFSVMQHEFELLLEEFAKKGLKVLFIIDELDKVDNPIVKILSLKMLLNQGNALFIFIAAPNILAAVDDETKPNNTLFSQILYLKRPLFDEMRRFITGIILNGDKLGGKRYRDLQDFLCYESKTSFFDLYNVIRDNMIETDPGEPVLHSRLTAKQITKSNLQKSIEQIYESKKYDAPSMWEENDKMLEAMYSICATFENTAKFTDIFVDDKTFRLSKDNLKLEDKPYSAAVDLITFLTSQGYLHEVEENNYRIVGHLSEFNEALGGIFVEEQRRFKEEYENVFKLAIHMANIHNRYIENLGEIFSLDSIDSKWDLFVARVNDYLDMRTFGEHREIYRNLVGSNPSIHSSEKLQRMTSDLQNGHTELKRQLITLLARIFDNKIDGLNLPQLVRSTDQGILSTFGLPNITLHRHELHFTDSPLSHKLQYVIITENIPRDIRVKLLRPTDQNILFTPLVGSDECSTYDNMPSVFFPDTLQQGLNELHTLGESSKKSLLMPLTVPIQSSDLDQILKLL